METVALLDCRSFRDLAQQRGVWPRRYESNYDALVAMDVLTITEQTGDYVLALVKEGHIPRETAGALLRRLLDCFAEPRDHANDIEDIQREVRRHGE